MSKLSIKWTDRIAKPIESREEAIAIGEEMAKKAAKKLKLKPFFTDKTPTLG